MFVLDILEKIFWFLVVLIPLVVIHEFGHLIMSRLNGVRVVEFGVGVPPRAWWFKFKGIIWSLNWAPLGGFAKIYGDHDAIDEAHYTYQTDPELAKKNYRQDRLYEIIMNQELQFFLEDNNLEYDESWKEFEKIDLANLESLENDKKTEIENKIKQLQTLIDWELEAKINSNTTFFSKKYWQKTLILIGGVTFNFATAFLLYFVLFGFVGTPPSPQFAEDINKTKETAEVVSISDNLFVFDVVKDGAAAKAGLSAGDEIIKLGDKDLTKINNITEFQEYIQSQKGAEMNLEFIKNKTGETINTKITPTEKDGRYLIGISNFGYKVSYKSKNLFAAAITAGQRVVDFSVLSVTALGDVFKALLPWTQDKAALDYISGPIAVSSVSTKVFDWQGPAGILNIMALVSISLGVFNLLPIPALDGGRWIIITLNAITKKRNKKLEARVITATFLFVLFLGVIIAFRDVIGITQGKF